MLIETKAAITASMLFNRYIEQGQFYVAEYVGKSSDSKANVKVLSKEFNTHEQPTVEALVAGASFISSVIEQGEKGVLLPLLGAEDTSWRGRGVYDLGNCVWIPFSFMIGDELILKSKRHVLKLAELHDWLVTDLLNVLKTITNNLSITSSQQAVIIDAINELKKPDKKPIKNR